MAHIKFVVRQTAWFTCALKIAVSLLKLYLLLDFGSNIHVQLFQERLSYKRVKANMTKSKVITDNCGFSVT